MTNTELENQLVQLKKIKLSDQSKLATRNLLESEVAQTSQTKLGLLRLIKSKFVKNSGSPPVEVNPNPYRQS